MRKNRKDMLRERIILMASGAFVLTALTMTGIYMRKNNLAKEEDYLSKIKNVEESTIGTLDQFADSFYFPEYEWPMGEGSQVALSGDGQTNGGTEADTYTETELIETATGAQKADSQAQTGTQDGAQKLIVQDEITAPTDLSVQDELTVKEEAPVQEEAPVGTIQDEAISKELPETETFSGGELILEVESVGGEIESISPNPSPAPARTLSFQEELIRPVSGNVRIPYNMSASVYFETLDHYTYNPAQIIEAAEGTDVLACAEGKVKRISHDARIGQTLVLELGGGYEAKYGQLGDITVTEGEYVNAGQVIAKVKKPTYFYAAEGSNLYFELTADGKPVNPEAYY